MSYPAILPTLPAFAPDSRRNPRPANPSQLLDWLRLAARQAFGADLAARIDPYRACSRCISQVRWCGHGGHGGDSGEAAPSRSDQWSGRAGLRDLWQTGITPLTPSLILGAKADPYSPAEAVELRTRGLLQQLARAPYARQTLGIPRSSEAPGTSAPSWLQEPRKTRETWETRETPETIGLEISILTRSPLLLRDLDLLAELDQRHAVTVGVLIPAADPRLARRLERPPRNAGLGPGVLRDNAGLGPGALRPSGTPASPPASPDERFDLVRALASHGIATEVLCTPVQPGLNNSVAVLRRLFDRAHQAGAFDVRPAPRHPAIPPTAAESRQLLALFHRLRLERGFPRMLTGRG